MTARDLVVIGGGIAGLVIAHDAARAGLRVEVLEASDRVGGMLRSAQLRGPDGPVIVDVGAESFATRTSGVTDLIADAGLELQQVAPTPGGAHLVALGDGGVLRAPLPKRTVLGIPADPHAADVVRILGAAAADRVAAERDLPPRTGAEPSLADLVTERCGETLTRLLVDPLCRSVYSQPASASRLSRLHPALWQQFQERGSLLDAAAAVASAQRAGAAVAGIAGGVWRLAAAVAEAAQRHGAIIRTGVTVAEITSDAVGRQDAGGTAFGSDPVSGSGSDSVAGAGLRVRTVDGEGIAARQVVVATGSAAAHSLLGAPGGTDGAAVTATATATSTTTPAATPASRLRVIAALVHAPALDAHPVGSGVIVAPDVPSAAKALTHVTAKWPWFTAQQTLPAGHHVVRLSARDADAPGLSTPADIAAEIALLTGIPLTAHDIVATVDQVWPDAVARPPVDDGRRADLARAGIHVAGAAVAGTGLASVVPHARALAAELVSALTGIPPVSVPSVPVS